ncbi:MAG TPA: M28 family peptidase [Kribbella sp.]|nr:M28 family peptidase [Kribbella sp.]
MRATALVLAVLLTTACDSSTADPAPVTTKGPTTASSPPSSPASPLPSRSGPTHSQQVFDTAVAVNTVRYLADRVGPREATSTAYRRAADWVESRFVAAGYRVRREAVPVPSGNSWGVPVRAGVTWNLIATPPAFNPTAPHLTIGAHLDTVPQAPGAEDNASGIAVLLGVADQFAKTATRLPTVFVAFGAEEPRGAGDNRHHYGSRAYVASLPAVQRNSQRGMVSLDRVGVGDVVPICTAGRTSSTLQRQLRAIAARTRVPSRTCANRSSDHWSFTRAGLAAVRLGSTPYAGYHSERDRPRVVDPLQLERTGRLLAGWLAGP